MVDLGLSSHKNILFRLSLLQPIPVAAQSNAPTCSLSSAGIASSNPAGGHRCQSLVCVAFSDRCLCVRLIILLEDSYRLWCV
jgi:hypothetical protein